MNASIFVLWPLYRGYYVPMGHNNSGEVAKICSLCYVKMNMAI